MSAPKRFAFVSPAAGVSPLGESPGGAGASTLRETVRKATTRIEEIIDAAAVVAEQIRSEAEAESNRLLEERRAEAEGIRRSNEALRVEIERLDREREQVLSGEIESVMQDLASLRGALVAATGAVEQGMEGVSGFTADFGGAARPELQSAPPAAATKSLDGPLGEPPAGEPIAAAPPAPAPPLAVPDESRQAINRFGGASEGAILLATQMAVSGAPRERIESRLRNDFGISDPGAILDDLDA